MGWRVLYGAASGQWELDNRGEDGAHARRPGSALA